MDISSIFLSICMMGLIVCIGIIIGMKTKVTQEAKQLLITIIVNVAVPAIIFNGVFNTTIDDSVFNNIIVILLIAVFVHTFGFFFGVFSGKIFGYDTLESRKLGLLAGLGNTGFIGIPLCLQLFGPVGGLLAAIFDASMDLIVFSFIIILLQQGERFSFRNLKSLLNIPFFAIVTGLSLAVIGFEPPVIAQNLAAFLSSLAAPLAMIYIGLLIPEFFRKKKKIRIKFVSISLIVKLLILPMILIALVQPLPVDDIVKQVTYVLVTMPTIMLAPILLARYTNDEDSGVMVTIYSTIFSLASIPLILYVANTIF